MGNILIVEDNELVRKIMVTILKIYFPNDSITEAIDGEKAMSIIKKNQPV